MSSHKSSHARLLWRAPLVIGASVALALGAAPAVTAAPVAPPSNRIGLYGTDAAASSATYNGVTRQSLAILGLHAAGEEPDQLAVDWLLDQQCADGSFMEFDTTPATDCTPYNSTDYTGPEIDATALAAQALLAVNEDTAANNAEQFLKDAQQADGGWEFNVGAGYGTNANSTGMALLALNAANITPVKDAATYLSGLQVGRTGTPDAADLGGIAYASFTAGTPDVFATAQAVPGLRGADLVDVVSPSPSNWSKTPIDLQTAPADDAEGIGDWAAGWLAQQDGTSAFTANKFPWAILTFASTTSARTLASQLYDDLAANVASTDPGALGLTALSAAALRENSDAQGYASLIAATLTTATGHEAAAPSEHTVSPGTAWIGQTVTVKSPYAGSGLAVTQIVDWGDGRTSSLNGTAATHTYAAAGTFTPEVQVTFAGYSKPGYVVLPDATVKRDTTDPKVTFAIPGNPKSARSWATLRGTASDNGLGVANVKIALVEKRGAAWYSYSGTKWTKRASLAKANAYAKRLSPTPASGNWSLKVAGLTLGTVKVIVTGTDKAGNTTNPRTITQQLTKK